MFTFEFDLFDWLSQFYSKWRETSKFSRFLKVCDFKIWKSLKCNSVPFIKKALVIKFSFEFDHSFSKFSVNEYKVQNQSISKFLHYTIQVKIWKCKTSYVCSIHQENTCKTIRTWLSWLTFTDFQWMKTNIKISQLSRFLLRSGYVMFLKIWKWLKLLNSVPFIQKTLVNDVYIRIWSSWLTFTVLQWMKKNFKISQFPIFLQRS